VTTSSYYPFGAEIDQFTSQSSPLYSYLYNGIERNTDFGLGWDMAAFRTMDALVCRWMQVDALSEVAPDYTPYRFGFNNPILFSDNLGLFESRREARRYKKQSGLKGRVVKNRETGRFMLVRGFKNAAYLTRNADGTMDGGAFAVQEEAPSPGAMFWDFMGGMLGMETKYFEPAVFEVMPGAGGGGLGMAKKIPVHHIATNKNFVSKLRGGPWSPRFEKIFKDAGLELKNSKNLVGVKGHKGPHPQEYHEYVYNALIDATKDLTPKTKAYTDAVVKTLTRIGEEAKTVGTQVNKWLTKTK
ncbi:MAG: AHH domain-containing protein, partial [Bacteroidota bacterium]